MKRFVRFWVSATLLIAVAVLLGAVVPRPLFVAKADDTPKPHRIFVLSNPIHTDIAVPIDDEVIELFDFLRQDGMPLDAPNASYLIFGRGGREFYISTPTWSDLKPMPLLKGVTLDRAAMHIDVAGEIASTNPAVLSFDVGDEQFDALLRFILDSFRRDTGRALLIPGVQYATYDRFYEANGYFNAAVGCNIWTAQGLRQAGLRTGWWNPTPATLRLSLRLYN
jgi:uncharacterized protein (TIGR02117 family)